MPSWNVTTARLRCGSPTLQRSRAGRRSCSRQSGTASVAHRRHRLPRRCGSRAAGCASTSSSTRWRTGEIVDRLDSLPQTLCHHDFHPANVVGANADVVVDWAYCGLGAFGLATQASSSRTESPMRRFRRSFADEVADAVWNGYLAGLREGGWAGDESDVRFAFARGTALRLSWLRRGERPAWDAAIAFLDRLASTE